MIYLDYAATSPIRKEVLKAMEPYFSKYFGNPSSLYSFGIKAKSAVENSREKIAKVLHAHPSEIIFTAGGTESVNLAIFGLLKKLQADTKNKLHVITTKIEHHAVLHSVQALEKQGIEATYLSVDQQGFVGIKGLVKAIKPTTVLVSIIWANNEIGTIQPINKIAKELRKINTERQKKKLPQILLHVDACQAGGALDLDVNKLSVDMMSLNGSKIYGPKQIGILYLRRGTKIQPIIYGGGQERDLRSGTENVPAIVGMATALELAQEERLKENARLRGLRNYLIKNLLKIPGSTLNGAGIEKDSEENPIRLPNNVNISIPNVEGEAMVMYLDAQGICISAGSACTSTSADPSHVIAALHKDKDLAYGLRLTLGHDTKKSDLDKVIKLFPKIATELQRVHRMDMTVV